MVNCQMQFDYKFGPLVKLTGLFMSDVIKPRSFNVGYQINLKNDARLYQLRASLLCSKARALFIIPSHSILRNFSNFLLMSFFCDVNETGKPFSVHKLTPGDLQQKATH